MLNLFTIFLRIILFVTTKNNQELNEEKIKIIKSKIRTNCSPKHVPSLVIKTPEIPRTKSGKIVELLIKKIINGENILNLETLTNPHCLKEYQDIYKTLSKNA